MIILPANGMATQPRGAPNTPDPMRLRCRGMVSILTLPSFFPLPPLHQASQAPLPALPMPMLSPLTLEDPRRTKGKALPRQPKSPRPALLLPPKREQPRCQPPTDASSPCAPPLSHVRTPSALPLQLPISQPLFLERPIVPFPSDSLQQSTLEAH